MKQKSSIYNILFCGTGGQGVLKASEVCGIAAVNGGYRVKKSEVHGMAQRGGSVESHLRFGAQVHSPLIVPGGADFLICFHEGEGKRLRHFLKKGGIDFSPLLSHVNDLPDLLFINTFFLGALAARLPMTRTDWDRALASAVAKRLDENKLVFEKGWEIGKNF